MHRRRERGAEDGARWEEGREGDEEGGCEMSEKGASKFRSV